MINITKTEKYGLELWLVLIDGIEVAQAWSEQGAKTIMIKLLNKGA
jgi:hypothetical protein